MDIRAPEGRRLPTLPTGGSVPSAMAGLTALFGMVRGGTPPQWPPSISLGENQQDFAGSTRLRSIPVQDLSLHQHYSQMFPSFPVSFYIFCLIAFRRRVRNSHSHVILPLLEWKSIGGLVRVGFGITAFTPPAYRRRSLQRPSWEVSSRRRLRA